MILFYAAAAQHYSMQKTRKIVFKEYEARLPQRFVAAGIMKEQK